DGDHDLDDSGPCAHGPARHRRRLDRGRFRPGDALLRVERRPGPPALGGRPTRHRRSDHRAGWTDRKPVQPVRHPGQHPDPPAPPPRARAERPPPAPAAASGTPDRSSTTPTPLPPHAPLPAATAAGAAALDAGVHAWDIAAATGQPSPLDDDLAAQLLPVARI